MKIEQEIMEMFDEEWREALWFEVMEDYVVTAGMKTYAIDQKLYLEEMRKHLKKLEDFISHIITLVQKREREEVVEKIHKLLENSEKYVPFQQVHYQSALTDLLDLIKQNEI